MTVRYRMTDQWRRPHGSENDRSMLIGPGARRGWGDLLAHPPPRLGREDSDETRAYGWETGRSAPTTGDYTL